MNSIDEALAAQARRREAQEREAAMARAVAAWRRAQEWPRCGQKWPSGKTERGAAALFETNGVSGAEAAAAAWRN